MLATLYSTPPYWPELALQGWLDRGKTLNQRVREGRWDEMAPLVNDEMLEVLLPTAPYAELPAVLRERYAGLGDAISFPLPPDPADDAEVARAIDSLRGAW